jgi:quinoprotein glucose dehydrogenase
MSMRRVLIACLVGCAGAAGAQERRSDWPRFGNDSGGSQYSPLDQINAGNVSRLEVAWVHHSGDVADQDSPTGATSLEVVPIHANDTLYYCTPLNRVFALDPATGAERWRFDPHAPGPGGKALNDKPRRASTCRAVAYWEAANPEPGKACEKRVFKADSGGLTYALDADTGRPCADFGAAWEHPGYVSHWDYESYGEGAGRGMSSPPTVIGDLLIATQWSDDGIANASDGMVRAWDVRTGALEWSFDPIPEDKRGLTGAANVWSTVSVDPNAAWCFSRPRARPPISTAAGGRHPARRRGRRAVRSDRRGGVAFPDRAPRFVRLRPRRPSAADHDR